MQRTLLAPGAPRLALCGALVAAAAVLAAPLLLPAEASALASTVAFYALLTCAGVLVRWRRRRSPEERQLWKMLGAALLTMAAGATLVVVGDLAGLDGRVMALLLTPVFLLNLSLSFLGVVRWTRPVISGSRIDPDHLVHAVCAVLVAVVGAQVAAALWMPGMALGLNRQLPMVVSTAGSVVLVGTLLSTTLGARRRGDWRPLVFSAALALNVVGNGLVLTQQLPVELWTLPPRSTWPLAIAVCAALPVVRHPRERLDAVITAYSGQVVSAAGLPAVAVAAVQGLHVVAGIGLLAVLASAARQLLDVRELGQLLASRRESRTDDLTRLANRRGVTAALEAALSAGTPCAVAVVDLDRFKDVNDSLGHAAGDALLVAVADGVRQHLRDGEVAGRLGGDEFVLVAPCPRGDVDRRAAELGALVASVLRDAARLSAPTLPVGASTGTATWRPGPALDPDDPSGLNTPRTTTADAAARLLRAADAAMYDAKRQALPWVAYDPEVHGDPAEQLALAAELRTALVEGQLLLHHQPQVDAATGQPVGVEALVRWQHPRRGLLAPAEFLDVTEAHGLMGLLTEEVLRQGITQQGRWVRAGQALRMSLNLPATALHDEDLPRRLAELLAEHGVHPHDVVLEVTEVVLLSDVGRGSSVVRALRELGVQLSIDDFGTGYSSLARLQFLPVDELKLDATFTRDLLVDERSRLIVASTVQLAHALGLRVVAEGVEDPATLECLAGLGCDEVQGYLFTPPLPAEELCRWWRARTARRATAAP